MAIIEAETRKLANGARIRVFDDDIDAKCFDELQKDMCHFQEGLRMQAEDKKLKDKAL